MVISYACAGEELVQPVAIRCADFGWFGSDLYGCFAVPGWQGGCAYESMGIVYCLFT